ncbi:MAG: DMT family transporter [Pseudomonadota bacterium]
MAEPVASVPGSASVSGGPIYEQPNVPRAVAFMVLAVSLFSCLDTTAKVLVDSYQMPVAQVTWVRFVVQFVALLVLVPLFGRLSVTQLFSTQRFGLQMVRSVLMALTTLFNFLAVEYLRLDQTITIMFLAPLVVALLAGPFLNEWVGWRRLVAILIGFAGILVAVHPGVAPVHPAVGYSFAAMSAMALFMIVTRMVASHDPPLVTLFYSMFAGVVFGAPFAIAEWDWPTDWTLWAGLVSLGLFGGAGHYLLILAYRLGPASTISPFIYFQILTMTLLGYLVFGDQPDVYTFVGSLLVVGSGVYLVNRERQLRNEAVAVKSEPA